jgi:hypothetical protein
VRDELVDFFERAAIEQEIDTLASGQRARGAPTLEALFAPAKLGSSFELVELELRIHYTRAA